MSEKDIIIVGGGIGSLTLGLTLYQIGLSCTIYEAVNKLEPRGVGINLLPNAVRELYELGIGAELLDEIGITAREWALVGTRGQEIYSEPRGEFAGYKWPQYAVHRGNFHMLLYKKFVSKAGQEAFVTGYRAKNYQKNTNGTVTVEFETSDGVEKRTADVLIGADGIHSAIRARMYPDQPPINWGGTLMWRGTSEAIPLRTDSSFVAVGNHRQRVVMYPITRPDVGTGKSIINWIAEITYDDTSKYENMGWFKQSGYDDFLHYFKDWKHDWLDVPELIRSADKIYENPMIDRDPIPSWVDDNVALLGDAAHPMYPVGSNGASQAIIDARVMCRKFLDFGLNELALKEYDRTLCDPISSLVLINRGAGPAGLLNIVDERCGGDFDDIEEIVPEIERKNFMEKFKVAAGFARDKLNAAPSIIPSNAKVTQ